LAGAVPRRVLLVIVELAGLAARGVIWVPDAEGIRVARPRRGVLEVASSAAARSLCFIRAELGSGVPLASNLRPAFCDVELIALTLAGTGVPLAALAGVAASLRAVLGTESGTHLTYVVPHAQRERLATGLSIGTKVTLEEAGLGIHVPRASLRHGLTGDLRRHSLAARAALLGNCVPHALGEL
jgi:hypothetical protein